MLPQAAILADVPPHAAFLFLDLRPDASPDDATQAIRRRTDDPNITVGLGSTLLSAVDAVVPGMRPMQALIGAGVSTPVTPTDLFIRVAGADPGDVLHRERALLASLPEFVVVDRVEGFTFGSGRDLTGYEDGTENPTGAAATATAFGAMGGGSVVAVQRWVHRLDAFDAMPKADQDAAIGRERHSNHELADAPESAHVKRTAQEDFEPQAFLLRRSMPWRDHRGAGLLFLSFSATTSPFEAQMRRMVGLDDGIVDAIFRFTRPVTGAMYWCPPVVDGRLAAPSP